MAYTTIDNPTKNFNTKLYTGNGSTQSITGVGFQPDWTWIKERNGSSGNVLIDSVRGVDKVIRSNQTGAESTDADCITSFDSDGYSLGADVKVNESSSYNYVGWSWLAGGSASSNSNGSITSSVSANTTAGFSIVSYTGTGSAATVGHGLGAAPEIVIVRRRNNSDGWQVYVNGLSSVNYYLRLDTTAAEASDSSRFGAAPTASVFSVGTANGTNASGDTYIAYCFASIKGYSKIGSYSGNGNADGTFVYTGFRPAFVLLKVSSTTNNWNMFDDKRPGINEIDQRLFPNLSDAEQDGTAAVDFLSNGFKFRNTNDNYNASSATYIYMALAKAPFVTAGTKAAGTAV